MIVVYRCDLTKLYKFLMQHGIRNITIHFYHPKVMALIDKTRFLPMKIRVLLYPAINIIYRLIQLRNICIVEWIKNKN